MSIADADGDGAPEIIAITDEWELALVDADGVIAWRSEPVTKSAILQVTVADLDADGWPEVVGGGLIVNGEDGTTVARLAAEGHRTTAPVAADLDQDGTLEVLFGSVVFHHWGVPEWETVHTNTSIFAAVANVDGDDGGEVFFLNGASAAPAAYLHDHDGTLIGEFPLLDVEVGPPAVADFDGDGVAEIAIPTLHSLTVYELDGTLVWIAPVDDGSGSAGCSGYDFDGDGAYEVLFADHTALRILDGPTGTQLYTNEDHDSGTLIEYPVVADVDNDGSAEIIYVSNGDTNAITVLGHRTRAWAKSGVAWGTHDFAVTNLDPDGHVPTVPEPSWRTHNVFRARPVVDDPAGSELAVSITDVCVATCDAGPIEVGLSVYNQGGQGVDAGVEVHLYADTDAGLELVASQVLPAIAAGERLAGLSFTLGIADLGKFGYVAVIDVADAERECDDDNNRDQWSDVYCP